MVIRDQSQEWIQHAAAQGRKVVWQGQGLRCQAPCKCCTRFRVPDRARRFKTAESAQIKGRLGASGFSKGRGLDLSGLRATCGKCDGLEPCSETEGHAKRRRRLREDVRAT